MSGTSNFFTKSILVIVSLIIVITIWIAENTHKQHSNNVVMYNNHTSRLVVKATNG